MKGRKHRGWRKSQHFLLFQQCFQKFFPVGSFWPITRRQILDSSKLKEFADDNFKLYKNGRKLSKRVENTVRKGEIVRYEQFLLFPQCFQKAYFAGASKGVIVWEWFKWELCRKGLTQTTEMCASPIGQRLQTTIECVFWIWIWLWKLSLSFKNYLLNLLLVFIHSCFYLIWCLVNFNVGIRMNHL